jgi:hypothetical protein
MPAHPHPIHPNIALHRDATNNPTLLIPTQTEKHPKPKKQTHPTKPMGWEQSTRTHPHEKKKTTPTHPSYFEIIRY